MSEISVIKHLIKREILLEFRQKFALAGILLYVVGTVFISYLSFKNIIHPATWNALFWIILLFASVNAIGKSFISESRGKQLYHYSLVSPQVFIVSKIIYNSLLMLVISCLCYLSYSVFISNIVQDNLYFFITIILGSFGFSAILTMVSAIASKTGSNFSLMAILSFPMLIPLLLTLIKVSKNAVDGLDRSLSLTYFIVILAINLIVVMLSYILFPYLWRD